MKKIIVFVISIVCVFFTGRGRLLYEKYGFVKMNNEMELSE